MKKIIFVSALTISTMFATSITGAIGAASGALGITAESVGGQLADIVKSKSPETAEQAKIQRAKELIMQTNESRL